MTSKIKLIDRSLLDRNFLLLVLCFIAAPFLVQAQDGPALVEETETEETGPNFSFSGSVDAYFRANLNSTNDGRIEEATFAPGTSFANLPGFALGMANFVGSYEGSKVGFTADLVFGPRGDEAVFGSINASGNPSNSAILNQLFVYWNATENLTFTLGNFNTFLGYEVISPTVNFNYSTSYMFSYGPFSHTGVKADFSLGGGFSGMLGVFNPTDATDFNPTGSYVGGAQLGYTNDAGGAWLNFLFDSEFFQIDLTTGWDVSETVYVGLNATSASDNFFGVAGYFQVSATDNAAFGIRGEYFSDQGLGLFATDDSVFDVTLTGNFTIGSLTFIPELRLDAFSNDSYVITNAAGDQAKSLTSFLLAAVYSF